MTQDGMWQDSGRYEWPLTGVPGEPAQGTALKTYDTQALVTNPYDRWYDPHRFTTAGSGFIEVVVDNRLSPERADKEIAALRHQVAELKAENCDLLIGHAELTRRLNGLQARVAELEQGKDGRTL